MNAKDLSTSEYSSHIVFITGGTKSGKSEFAEYLAKEVKKLSYVALSENNLDDTESVSYTHLTLPTIKRV